MYSKITYGGGDKPYNYAEFLCNTIDDLQNLPTSIGGKVAVGSKATVISPRQVYILDNNNQWRLIETMVSAEVSTILDGES